MQNKVYISINSVLIQIYSHFPGVYYLYSCLNPSFAFLLVHDDADNRSYSHSDNPEADDNVDDTSPSMTCETKNEEIMLKPYSMNVLKHSGINTDILSEILKKHEKLSKEPSRNNNHHTVTELNDNVVDNSHYSNQHDILNGDSINAVRDNMRASYANYLYEKDIASSGYGSTVDDALFN